MTTSEEILKWFDENKDWFKPTSISKKLKIDKGNFSRYLKSGIPEKYLIPIMEIIMPLGFTLDSIIDENNKPEVKAKIEEMRNPKISIKDLSQPSNTIKPITEKRPSSNYVVNTTIPPIPVRLPGEDSFDFAARKNEWKKLYGK